jgi:Zn-finger nucleic acid-binding protein
VALMSVQGALERLKAKLRIAEKRGVEWRVPVNSSDHPTPGTLQCPNCGGDATPDTVRCEWCHSSLAAVACPSCFESVFVGMRHCPWCGADASRVQSDEKETATCPHCQLRLVKVQVGGTALSECRSCGGLWVQATAFEKICADREDQEAVLGRPMPELTPPSPKVSKAKRMYIGCPICGQLMNRMNFAGCSGVIIDWCKAHGSWFDHSELSRVVRFIQSGGLKKSRERAKEEVGEDLRRLRDKERELMRLERRTGSSSAGRVDWAEDSTSLLDVLSSVWKGLRD